MYLIFTWFIRQEMVFYFSEINLKEIVYFYGTWQLNTIVDTLF
jgi:hypothetical protein